MDVSFLYFVNHHKQHRRFRRRYRRRADCTLRGAVFYRRLQRRRLLLRHTDQRKPQPHSGADRRGLCDKQRLRRGQRRRMGQGHLRPRHEPRARLRKRVVRLPPDYDSLRRHGQAQDQRIFQIRADFRRGRDELHARRAGRAEVHRRPLPRHGLLQRRDERRGHRDPRLADAALQHGHGARHERRRREDNPLRRHGHGAAREIPGLLRGPRGGLVPAAVEPLRNPSLHDAHEDQRDYGRRRGDAPFGISYAMAKLFMAVL